MGIKSQMLNSRIFLFLCLAFLIAIGSAVANPYGYGYFRTVTIDHTKVSALSLNGYSYSRGVTVDHTKVGLPTINGYAWSRSITIDHTKVGTVNNTDQSNFPVLISGSFNGAGGTFDARTAANGGPVQNTVALNGQTVPADIIFTSDAGCTTKLNWEIASYTASTGAIEAWVQVPMVSHSSNTTIYMCYDNASVNTYQGSAASTWDSNFKGVWHLPNGSSLSASDSTSNAYNLTNTGSVAAMSGQIDGAASFSGSNYLSTPSFASLSGSPYTISFWVYNTNNLNSNEYLMLGLGGQNADYDVRLSYYYGSATIAFNDRHESQNFTSANISSGWVNIVLTQDSSKLTTIYSNGASIGSITASSAFTGNQYLMLGGGWYDSSPQPAWNGALDEVKISNTNRSADWIITEYNNQSAPSTFYTVGSQTGGGSDQTNFPVLISGTYNGSSGTFDARTAANGGPVQNTTTLNGQTVPADLIFTSDSSCATNLNWEIASYTASSGQIEAWVKIPALSHTSDTIFYMCYGKSSVTTYQGSATSTWDSNYKAVWHMTDNAANKTVLDSTSNATNGTEGARNTSVLATTGKIAGGLNNTSANGDYAHATDPFDPESTASTLSFWFNPTSNSSTESLGGFMTGPGDNEPYDFIQNNAGTLRVYAGGGNIPYANLTSVSTGAWYYVSMVTASGSGALTIYINGTPYSPGSIGASAGFHDPTDFYIGVGYPGTSADAIFDEARVSNVSRSADWIVTEYHNQNSPSTFYTLGSQISSSLTNFPVLISGTYSYLATGANGGQIQKTATLNGQTVPVDLIFTSDAAGKNLLNWEVASYNPANGQIEVWVQIPALTNTADTVFYMWYNNANIPATYLGNATSTWDSNYKGVWHFPDGTTLAAKDSTSNANNGTINGATATVGKIAGGANSTNQNIDFGASTTLDSSSDVTVSAWANINSFSGTQGLVAKRNGGGFANYGINYSSTSGQWYFNNGSGWMIQNYTGPSTGVWTYFTGVFTKSGGNTIANFYENGSLVAGPTTLSGNLSANSSDLVVGESYTVSGEPSDTKIDELRVSNTTRSAAWIQTEYNNQNSPSTFTTIGAQGIAHRHTRGILG
jgi:hypothetical protein